MMKLSSIRIQGMHNVVDKTYKLNNMNYFVGPNGAGKSTIMQAIQLALLGYIPGTDKRNQLSSSILMDMQCQYHWLFLTL
jgi:ATPase involved in DNA repair